MMVRFKNTMLKLALAGLIGAALVGCGASSQGSANAEVPASAEQVARGRYLARAGDCAACHTAKDGAPFAGGYPLHTPFGTIHGTNITPDKEHGIGGWSSDDFYLAMTDGVTPDHRLYPAMPYTSYRAMKREDSDAIYAYLMAQKPVAQPNLENGLSFPFNIRAGLWFWQALFVEDKQPDVSAGSSASWQRGRYVSNVLGHCAECHTPRKFSGQMDFSRQLQGNTLDRIGAPDITPEGLAARGWTLKDLNAFFATGLAPQGSAYGEMYPVVHLSTQHLSKSDLSAMSTYLLGDKPPAPQPVRPVAADAAELQAGRQVCTAVCAGCHGGQGEGKPHVAVAMKGNSTVRLKDARNLIVATLDGIEE
ncbi:c-type cytochrome [Crenobacter cavernae]|uniref:c-type cytochrome n=1 Tax=Crenobacter cavernae TaxID=2290923 RepID=UPI001C6995DC|nr:c-type cytochrome [Crenobacter cavernae]